LVETGSGWRGREMEGRPSPRRSVRNISETQSEGQIALWIGIKVYKGVIKMEAITVSILASSGTIPVAL
jgi:hypothetical protein